MRPVHFDAEAVLAPFYRHKVLTKDQHLQCCSCSAMTAWRAMHAHGYLSSYNFNAKYYTLADIPEFDDHGLWSYRGVRFSRFGSLPRTMSELIERSDSGMSAAEVEHGLEINNGRATLARLFAQRRLNRKKITGLLLYFSADTQRYQQQMDQRQAEQHRALVRMELPEPDRIIAILVERIQRPGMDARQLARRLARKGLKISPHDIEAVFVHYDLEKKRLGAVGVAR